MQMNGGNDAAVLLLSVITLVGLSACVFGKRISAPSAASKPKPTPRENETVTYGEFSNDGSLWRARTYAYSSNAGWECVRTCYPSSGKGCGPGWREIRYAPAASVAGLQRVEINSDRRGFLRALHPKSEFVDDPGLWDAVRGIAASEA